MSKPCLLDLFSGVGGFSLAFERAGFKTHAFSEVDAFACRVLAERWPGVPNLGDVTKITVEQLDALGDIDVVTFGSPCQDWSVAGKRLGLKGHRSSLFHEAIRIVRLCQPRLAVFENVPGLFSSAGGWDFAAVLDEMAESGALDLAWGVLDAQWFGVPQRRRRIFVVADFREERAGEILSISEGVCRDTPPSRQTGEEAARSPGDGTQKPSFYQEAEYGVGQYNTAGSLRAGRIPEHQMVAGSQPTRYGKGVNTTADDGAVIPATVRGEGVDSALTSGNHGVSEDGTGWGTPVVAFQQNQRDEVRLMGGNGQSVGALPAEPGMNQQNYINAGMAVRRLTPLECERLQGFPDGWTDIPGASDSARYRAMGNAVAVPVVEWIARRMHKELP